MNLRAVFYRLHLWFGLILGVQIFIWLLSGAVMTLLHITLVRGETNSFVSPPVELSAETFVSPGRLIAMSNGATSVTLKTFLGETIYIVESHDGVQMYSARTGKLISPISESQAREVANADFIGDAEIVSADFLQEAPQEYRRGTFPVWRMQFNDRLNTRLYISAQSGRVNSRRNDVWRIFDFFWMLHIMDYVDRENFNHPLVQGVSVLSTIFAAIGLILLLMRQSRTVLAGDIRWIKSKITGRFQSS